MTGARYAWLRGTNKCSTAPDTGNAGVGKKSGPSRQWRFFVSAGGKMKEEKTRTKKVRKLDKYFGRILTVRGITELAVLVALAIMFDLPFLKIRFGEGASLSLTMVPLFIIALRFPLLDSFLGIGLVYGFITMLLDGYGFITYPLDYLLAYGSIAVASLFQNIIFTKRNNLVLNYIHITFAVISGVLLRIWWSTLSGVIVYQTPFWASFVYNAPPMAGSGLIAIVMLTMLYPTLQMFKTNDGGNAKNSSPSVDE